MLTIFVCYENDDNNIIDKNMPIDIEWLYYQQNLIHHFKIDMIIRSRLKIDFQDLIIT